MFPADTGLTSLYVVYAKPHESRKGVPEVGHDYHPAPKTDEILGIPGLHKEKGMTPRQGGGGVRPRWKDAKGRTVYEWDFQHGELEGYRTSDGEHLGSFEPKTGELLKPAVKGRNIKKYL